MINIILSKHLCTQRYKDTHTHTFSSCMQQNFVSWLCAYISVSIYTHTQTYIHIHMHLPVSTCICRQLPHGAPFLIPVPAGRAHFHAIRRGVAVLRSVCTYVSVCVCVCTNVCVCVWGTHTHIHTHRHKPDKSHLTGSELCGSGIAHHAVAVFCLGIDSSGSRVVCAAMILGYARFRVGYRFCSKPIMVKLRGPVGSALGSNFCASDLFAKKPLVHAVMQ